jgi:hypothetical protein
LYDCSVNNGVWDITATTCAGVNCPIGAPAHDDCNQAIPITVGSYTINNQCATTDGLAIDSDFGGSQLDYDLWFEFTAPAACDLVLSECPTGLRFDSMIAVYSNCQEGEPGACDTQVFPACPLTAALNAAHLAGIGQDESCTGVAVGRPGIWKASEQIGRNAIAGEKFLFRIGSFPGGRGTANLSIDCPGGGGGTPDPVSPESNASCTAAGVPSACCSGLGAGTCDKSRFLSFNPATGATAAASETAIRIKLNSLHHVFPLYTAGPTIPFTAFEGKSVYVGAPQDFIESTANPTPFKAAFTQCAPYYQDWSTVGLVHVTGAAIVPSSIYTVEHLGAGCLGVEDTCTLATAWY